MVGTEKVAVNLGFDISTTGVGAGVITDDGKEGYFSVSMRGATCVHGQPAHDLRHLPIMMEEALQGLSRQGWVFSPPEGGKEKSLSLSVRQHDMVIRASTGDMLLPALSWQCNAAEEEAKRLNSDPEVREVVGPVEARFILPKLLWVLGVDSTLKQKISSVMTTGDWVAAMLTGQAQLATSDGLSNGLLDQQRRELAARVLLHLQIPPGWFPPVIPSGRVVGIVRNPQVVPSGWGPVATLLKGWQLVAGLGDNHATGVGCGLDDDGTIVVSAGSSGTVVRRCSPSIKLRGKAGCFEYYGKRLLLMMLHECGEWYKRFRSTYAVNRGHAELDEMALKTSPDAIFRVGHEDGKGETYPQAWPSMSLQAKVGSTQFSIVVELLALLQQLREEDENTSQLVSKFVLTGGLSQSQFFQRVFAAGVAMQVSNANVFVSDRQGSLAHQTAAWGALLNSMMPEYRQNLSAVVRPHCPLKPCATGPDRWLAKLNKRLRAC